jgi:hypothetical protein
MLNGRAVFEFKKSLDVYWEKENKQLILVEVGMGSKKEDSKKKNNYTTLKGDRFLRYQLHAINLIFTP